jgi:hypothetical protein
MTIFSFTRCIFYGLLLITCLRVYSLEYLHPIEKQGQWGYQDKTGQWNIQPQFHLAQKFNSRGIAAVADDSGWVYIDARGKKLIRPFIVDNGPDYFREGLSRFTSKNKFGFFNASGKVVIKPKYDFAAPFSEGMAAVCTGCKKVKKGEHTLWKGGKWGYIDREGKIILSFNYKSAEAFNIGWAKVKTNEGWKYINKQGEIIKNAPDKDSMPVSLSPSPHPGQLEAFAMAGDPPAVRSHIFDHPVQEIAGGPMAAAAHIFTARKNFRQCTQGAFLEIARGCSAQQGNQMSRVRDSALYCFEKYFNSMKGGINLSKGDIDTALALEEKRQWSFYLSLVKLVEKFGQYKVKFEIGKPGYHSQNLLWNTGPSPGRSIKTDNQVLLYAFPLFHAETRGFLIPDLAPNLANVIYIDTSLMIFMPHNSDPGEEFQKAAREIFGIPENISQQIPEVPTARLYRGFLKLSALKDLNASFLEQLRKKHNVAAVLKVDSKALEAAIFTGDEEEKPRLWRELRK